MSDRRFYVYYHVRSSDNSIFYIGKGVGRRMLNPNGRSQHWNRVASKYGWTARHVISDIPEACALSLEKVLISIRREFLVNATDGGEGVSGMSHSDESKRKMSISKKGKVTGFWKGKKMPEEIKEKFRRAKLGKSQSAEHAGKSRMAKLGKRQPRDAVEKVISLKRKPIASSDGRTFLSANEAARQLSKELGVNCSQGNISMVANGQRKIAYGMKWEYIGDIS